MYDILCIAAFLFLIKRRTDIGILSGCDIFITWYNICYENGNKKIKFR